MNNNFTFLTESQIFGTSRLNIFNEYGTKCAITDFSILLGGGVSDYHVNKDSSLKERTGSWWTQTQTLSDSAHVINENGARAMDYVINRSVGARPALSYSSISSSYSKRVVRISGVKELDYGEYPQTIVDEYFSRELERAYSVGNIRLTGKKYTTNSILHGWDEEFSPRNYEEYEYQGKKYIRFIADKFNKGKELSDGRQIEADKPYWVAVEPITWLIDENADIALSKKVIFSGVQFKDFSNIEYSDFDRSTIKQFMDKYFSKEIVVNEVYSQVASNSQIQEDMSSVNGESNEVIKEAEKDLKIKELQNTLEKQQKIINDLLKFNMEAKENLLHYETLFKNLTNMVQLPPENEENIEKGHAK